MEPEALFSFASLAGLPDRTRAAIATVLQERIYPPGQVIIRQGTSEGGVYFLVAGEVRIDRVLEDGSSVTVTRMRPGSIFGALAPLDGAPRGATCTTVGTVRCGEMSRVDFARLMEGSTPVSLYFQFALLRQLYSDLRRSNGVLAEMASLPSEAITMELVIPES